MGGILSSQTSLETLAVEIAALTVTTKSKRQFKKRQQHQRNQRNQWQQNQDMVCYYCLRKGHYESECRLKKKSKDLCKERQQKRKSEAAITGSSSRDNIANIARALIHKNQCLPQQRYKY